ncbi:molecular chaperone DnaJ [Patescibacteria group bacterium]
MANKDYYNILGVNRSASSDEIKRAFRKKAHEHHPDKGNGDDAKFKEVNEAYQVLSNDEKRKQYDQFGATFDQAGGFGGQQWQDYAQQGQGGFSGDFSDIGDIFGDLFGFGSRRRAGGRTRGADIQVDVTVEFIDAAFGKTESIEIHKDDTCPNCNGNTAEPGTKLETCKNCQGSGQVEAVQRTILGAMRSARVCEVCNGDGTIPEKPCKKCKGKGHTRQSKQLDIKIPAGIADSQSIRLSGQGEIGQSGAQAGDLYVTVHVKPDNRFKRDGFNIVSKAEISFSQAALGTQVDIENIDGEIKLKVPPGTQSGKIFKLSSKGIPKLNSSGRGDHLVTILVKTPIKLSKKAKKLLEELDES